MRNNAIRRLIRRGPAARARAGIFLTALLAIACQAHAGEFRDLRFSVGIIPGLEDADLSGPGGKSTITHDAETGINFAPQFVFGRSGNQGLGWMGGIGLLFRNHEGTDSGGTKAKLAATGIEATGGLVFPVGPRGQIEMAPTVGFGSAKQSIDLAGLGDGRGPYLSLGIRAGGYFMATEHLQLGADVGYLYFQSKGTISVLGTDTDVTFKGNGPTASVTLGYRF
jgi:hypothetical protein